MIKNISTTTTTTTAKATDKQKFLSKVEKGAKKNDCWKWLGGHSQNGYGIYRTTDGATVLAHRHSYRPHNGEIPAGGVIQHTCDVKDCQNPLHLVCGTQRDNMRDKIAKGRQKSSPTRRRVTPEERIAIYEMLDAGSTAYEVAKHFKRAEINISIMKKHRSKYEAAAKAAIRAKAVSSTKAEVVSILEGFSADLKKIIENLAKVA
jgi:hypothetical protein